MIRRIKRAGSLIAATIFSTFLIGFSSGARFLAINLLVRGFLGCQRRMNLSPLNLSRAVEAAGTVRINVVSWSVPVVFAAGLLGLQLTEIILWALFAFIVPLLSITYGYIRFTLKRLKEEPTPATTTTSEEDTHAR